MSGTNSRCFPTAGLKQGQAEQLSSSLRPAGKHEIQQPQLVSSPSSGGIPVVVMLLISGGRAEREQFYRVSSSSSCWWLLQRALWLAKGPGALPRPHGERVCVGEKALSLVLCNLTEPQVTNPLSLQVHQKPVDSPHVLAKIFLSCPHAASRHICAHAIA